MTSSFHRVCAAAAPLLLVAPACQSTAGAPVAGEPRTFAVEVEAGAAWQTRNDVAIPGDTGTRFALDDVIGEGPFPVGRIEMTWQPADRHELRAVIAPLEFSGDGTLDAPVDFAGSTFAAGTDTHASFRFDSYRLTYRYQVWRGEAWEWRVGLTAFLRDAEIAMEQAGVSGSKSNTAVVPLLNIAGTWRLTPAWRLALDADAAAAPQGRAIDAALKGYWSLAEDVELGFGYRTIEGGADNDEVYTFAWIHEAVLSLRYAF